MHGNAKSLTGQRFGRLIAILATKERRNRRVIWECVCSCGNKTRVSSNHLLNGNTKSCGCLNKEHAVVHGGYGTRLHKIWNNMNNRCKYSPQTFPTYGGRGIKVKFANFPEFKEWAEANGYADNLTIDRIDNDGDYEPANCQWLTLEENGLKGSS